MLTGLRCLDAQGNVTLDINDRATRLLGTVQTILGAGGSISVPEFATGTPWVVCQPIAFPTWSLYYHPKPVAIALVVGSTLVWSSGSRETRIIYGVY